MIAHSVAMVAVQAESATYMTPELPGPARDAFQQIAGTARSSMAELRRLLGVLRAGTGSAAMRTPQPTLAGLEELVEQHRAVGGSTDLRVLGERTELPASWELSAYRIVQEALTNARRHAPGAHAVVEIDHRPGVLAVRVSDDGPGPPEGEPDCRSHVLVGMRERATLLGGRLTAGRGPTGGFPVEAEAREIVSASGGATKALMLTTFDLDEYVYDALAAGAGGFLLKDATFAELLHAVRVVADGRALLAPEVTQRLIAEFVRQRPGVGPHPGVEGLTAREAEVLVLIARGLSNADIAGRLAITDHTVKTHINRLFAKMGLRDRAQAVILAYELGLVVAGRENHRR